MKTKRPPSKYVDLDLSWLQATGEVRYLSSTSPTATTTDNCWGLRYEKIVARSKINAHHLFDSPRFPLNIDVKIVKGCVLMQAINKYSGDVTDEVRLSLYNGFGKTEVRTWLDKHCNKPERYDVLRWVNGYLELGK